MEASPHLCYHSQASPPCPTATVQDLLAVSVLYGGWRHIFLLSWFVLWWLSSLAWPTSRRPVLHHSCQFAQSHLSRLQPLGFLRHDSRRSTGEPKEITCHIHRVSKGHLFSVATEHLPQGDELMITSSFVMLKFFSFVFGHRTEPEPEKEKSEDLRHQWEAWLWQWLVGMGPW